MGGVPSFSASWTGKLSIMQSPPTTPLLARAYNKIDDETWHAVCRHYKAVKGGKMSINQWHKSLGGALEGAGRPCPARSTARRWRMDLISWYDTGHKGGYPPRPSCGRPGNFSDDVLQGICSVARAAQVSGAPVEQRHFRAALEDVTNTISNKNEPDKSESAGTTGGHQCCWLLLCHIAII